ncbi:hypothetical protein [Verrucomicrobium sp. BvORR034]|uniref:hypothetical protein n=1 Tax=Verrucomicrobium sp. BvORR034 TaxID=1396418 RepID=UPI000679CFF6|nr:hypothetical protein [Verrucomicrobium sp. BvORR034]
MLDFIDSQSQQKIGLAGSHNLPTLVRRGLGFLSEFTNTPAEDILAVLIVREVEVMGQYFCFNGRKGLATLQEVGWRYQSESNELRIINGNL